MRRFFTLWSLCGLGIFALAGARAQAATLTVTNLSDSPAVNGCTAAGSGDGCTLREAITAANADAATDTIVFASGLAGGTITLGSVLPDLRTNLNISNPATQTVTLARSGAAGTPSFRILRLNNGLTGPTVTLSGLTITNGNADSSAGYSGGGIRTDASNLTLTRCTVVGNTCSESGGGIYAEESALTLLDCTVSNNANGQGGGGLGGGGICNILGTVTLANTTLAGNFGVYGGGLYSTNAATITNCTIFGNTGDIAGGGLFLNSENNTGSGTNTVSHCTITGNKAGPNDGGGIDLGYGSTTLSNNIIAGNTVTDVDLYPSATSNHLSGGYNLVGGGDALGVFTQTGDKAGVTSAQLNLSSLQDNGGPTQTLALLAGSVAINAGNPGFNATNTPYDQRGAGYVRVYNGRLDVGAYEAQPSPVRATVRGRIYNAVALNGLSELKVRALRQDDNTVTLVTTSSDGSYTLNLAVGTYTLSAYHPAAPSTFPIVAAFSNPVNVASTNLTGYNFRAVGIGGRVISPSNVGIQNVKLDLYGPNDTALKKVLRSVRTDAQGFFSFDGIVPGTWNVVPVSPTTYTYTPGSRLIPVQNQAVFTSFRANVKPGTPPSSFPDPPSS